MTNSPRLLKRIRKSLRQLGKRPESMRSSNSRESLLGQRTRSRVDVKHGIFIACIDSDADNRYNEVDGDDGKDNECQFPLHGESDDKG